MNGGTSRVRFTIGETVIDSEWRDTSTARRLLAVLPVRAQVEPGTAAFWTQRSCLRLFWGPTPASHGKECRAASNVNIVGRVTNPDALRALTARALTVDRA
ncbi:MAG: hypothetical protein FJW31_23755 [Acidobacteria bacterium]|nr:hypothetical protein [Acidobacteriota bacterium]